LRTLDIKALRESLDYNPETGLLTWKKRPLSHFVNKHVEKRWNARFGGKKAGSLKKVGQINYRKVCINGWTFHVHRVALALHLGSWPVDQIDHIDGDGENNRLNNLRIVSSTENSRNQKLHKNNTSGYNGVRWRKEKRKWVAQIGINGVHHYLGSFTNIKDAIDARARANDKYGFSARHGT
jgi:hypothetical protein